MTDKPPTSMVELVARTNRNMEYFGTGFDTGMWMPCPFCAAPHWLKVMIAGEFGGHADIDTVYNKGATCSACERSARMPVTRYRDGSVSFTIVQTGGPDQPDWFEPKMPRET